MLEKDPLVSIIIPCRNEEKFIGGCLDSIIGSDYPKGSLEVFVVDGMSEDRTREILAGYTASHGFIRMLENRNRTTPYAFNIGIRQARGDVVMIMGMHASYASDYVSKCVRYLREYDADNVGGVMVTVPRDEGLVGKAITTALSHRFGVGNSAFRTGVGKEPVWVDTVFGGCYKKEVFDKVGLFNERLTHSQDMEFNLRLKKAGLRTLLAPEITCSYYARSDIRSFFRHNFNNGLWVVLPILESDIMPVSMRHLVPLVFVGSLAGSALLSLFAPLFLVLLIAILGAYLAAALYFSGSISVKKKDWRFFLVMPATFASLHVMYGLGSLWGVVRLITKRRFWTDRVLVRAHN